MLEKQPLSKIFLKKQKVCLCASKIVDTFVCFLYRARKACSLFYLQNRQENELQNTEECPLSLERIKTWKFPIAYAFQLTNFDLIENSFDVRVSLQLKT